MLSSSTRCFVLKRLVTGGSAEGIAGDQLCQWNTIAPDAIIPATHLTLFLPPSLGAYVMANHQTHRDFKPQPSSSTNDIPTFTVQQWLHFPLPDVFKNQVELLNMARYAAADGYITPAAIPFLSHSLTNQDMTFQKIKWSLRFPLPTPSPPLQPPLPKFSFYSATTPQRPAGPCSKATGAPAPVTAFSTAPPPLSGRPSPPYRFFFPNSFSYGVFANIGSGAASGGRSGRFREGSGAGSGKVPGQVPNDRLNVWPCIPVPMRLVCLCYLWCVSLSQWAWT